MKNLNQCLVPAILVMTGGTIFGADWRPVNSGLPVTIAGVGVLTVDPKTPSTVYATTTNWSVFKTTDSGGSWKQISSVTEVRSLIVDSANPTTLYAATWRGVVKSLDGGETWTGANTGLPDGGNFSLVADPSAPSTLYAQTGGALFKSTDGAETWTSLASKFYASAEATIPLFGASFYAHAVVIDPKNSSTMYSAVWAPSDFGFFKSSDGGSTWRPANNLPAKVQFDRQAIPVFDPVNPSTMYVGYTDDYPRQTHLFKSADDGASWNEIGDGFPANSYLWTLAIDPTTPSSVYAAYGGENGWGVIKSSDGGQTFNKLDTGLPPYNTGSIVAISPTSPSTVYAGYFDFSRRRGRLVKSEDGGASWNAADAGLTRIDVRTLAIDPASASTVYAGVGGGEGVFKSVDNGAQWSGLAQFQVISSPPTFFVSSVQDEPGAVSSLLIPPANPSILYAATARISGACIFTDRLFFKSTDGGANWSDIGPQPSGCNFIWSPPVMALDPNDSDDLYLGGGGDCGGAFLHKSSDGGLDWKFLSGGFADTLSALAIDPTNPAILYAGTSEGVFKSTNGGVDWTKTGPSAVVNALAIDHANPSILYAATGNSYAGFRGMFKSIDGGANWTPIDNGLASVIGTRSPVTALAIAPDRAIYAATSGHGVYKSSDLGASWTPFNGGLTNLDVRVLTVSSKAPNTLYAVTPGGTFTMIDEVK